MWQRCSNFLRCASESEAKNERSLLTLRFECHWVVNLTKWPSLWLCAPDIRSINSICIFIFNTSIKYTHEKHLLSSTKSFRYFTNDPHFTQLLERYYGCPEVQTSSLHFSYHEFNSVTSHLTFISHYLLIRTNSMSCHEISPSKTTPKRFLSVISAWPPSIQRHYSTDRYTLSRWTQKQSRGNATH